MALITLCRYHQKVAAGQIIFTTSQTWTVPKGVKKVDIFIVGGGGGGGATYSREEPITETASEIYHNYGGGGGGGYTATYNNISLLPNSQVPVVIGSGGVRANVHTTNGLPGGSSSFGEYSVGGGSGGNSGGTYGGLGGAGGSGGGGGAYSEAIFSETFFYVINPVSGAGGVDGSNGTDGNGGAGGVGQGATTKAFGELDGTLYASGGSGAENTPNTGNGGNGGGNGCSGVVIVRWAEQ